MCVTVIHGVAYIRYLEIMIAYDRQCMCVMPVPGVRVAGCGTLACVGSVPATVLVSECVTAQCMNISNDSAIPPRWLLLFICRGAIIPFHLLDVHKQESLFL